MQNEDREPPISRNGYRLYGLLGRRVLADIERITLTRLGRKLLWRTAIGD
jgi:hypothetical protein